MAIIVEDGTLVAGANSYASEAELAAYADLRGIVITGIESELLITAMDYIESRAFLGTKKSVDQALVWPRNGVYIDGFLIADDAIPQLLKDAQMEAALAVEAGSNPSGSVARATKREKLGEMEVEYMDGAAAVTINRALSGKLSKLVYSSHRLIRT